MNVFSKLFGFGRSAEPPSDQDDSDQNAQHQHPDSDMEIEEVADTTNGARSNDDVNQMKDSTVKKLVSQYELSGNSQIYGQSSKSIYSGSSFDDTFSSKGYIEMPPLQGAAKTKSTKNYNISINIIDSDDEQGNGPNFNVTVTKQDRNGQAMPQIQGGNIFQIEGNLAKYPRIVDMNTSPSIVEIETKSNQNENQTNSRMNSEANYRNEKGTYNSKYSYSQRGGTSFPGNAAQNIELADDTGPQRADDKVPVYNILLLGETGAGKSTTINAFANYLKYANFEQAVESDGFVQLIPSKFTLPDPETGLPFVIQSGKVDDNEHQQDDGMSNTQSPMGYTFRFKDRMIRIIDTPGMGDTRGQDIDKQNFEKILSYLNYHTEMHAICILIKSNETRKTASFRYCITELLSHLHKSACKNIIFCFTFSRNSYYGAGEGFTILKHYLKTELKEVNLEPIRKLNCFFIDNEAYRFLVAKKQGYPFAENQTGMFKESWDESAKSTKEMLDHILSMEPHNLTQTTSLNHARKLIMEMAEPMVQLQKNIALNIRQIQIQGQQLQNSKNSRDVMVANMNIVIDDLQMRQLPKPSTVCTEVKCSEVITVNGQHKMNYKTKCHEPCYVHGVKAQAKDQVSLQHCSAFDLGRKDFCLKCGCHWRSHMHITHEYVKVQRNIVDQAMANGVNKANKSIAKIGDVLQNLKQVLQEYRQELETIKMVATKFGYILAVHSNTAFNKFIEPYLDLLIDEEQKMLSLVPGYTGHTLEMLMNIKEDHVESVKKLKAEIANQKHPEVELKHIPELRDTLLSLKHHGRHFAQMLKSVHKGENEGFKHHDRVGLDLS